MKPDSQFLSSKLGRRIVTLFFLCALLPIAALALLSFTQVTNEFNEQIQSRLRQASKTQGMAIFERLQLLEAGLSTIAADLTNGSHSSLAEPSHEIQADMSDRFTAVSMQAEGRVVPLFGIPLVTQELSSDQLEHLGTGGGLLITPAGGAATLVMLKAMSSLDLSQGILMAEIKPEFLWNAETLPAFTHLCVLGESNRVLFSSFDLADSLLSSLGTTLSLSRRGHFEWEDPQEGYIAGYWSIFFKTSYLTPDWTVIITEPKAHAFAPVAEFRGTFPLVTGMSVCVVLLLSIVQIWRILDPLRKLKQGTQRIAQRDFRSRVDVNSGDEFQELATSFNGMAVQIDRQFNALKMMNEIDRAILSHLDPQKLANTLLDHINDILPCDAAGVTLFGFGDTEIGRTYVGTATGTEVFPTVLTEEEQQFLTENPETIVVDGQSLSADYLSPLRECGMRFFLVLPLFADRRPVGIIVLGYEKVAAFSEEEQLQARQVADQVAVALASTRLLNERRELTHLFERYVSPRVATEIMERRNEISLAGEEKTATVLFSDIRNFTGLTAGKPSAEVLSWLNDYFSVMSRVVMKNGGFLNKFMGDGMLVVFGVPLSHGVEEDARSAIRSALEMLSEVEHMNARRDHNWPAFKIGIGIHTGPLTAGSVGSHERMEYSVIGATVNLASRMEDLTKYFSANLVISADTQALIASDFSTSLLGETSIRGLTGNRLMYTATESAPARRAG